MPEGTEERPSQPHKVHLSGTQETLLIPLYARALDSRSSHPILGDKQADQIVRMIDYDFEKVRGFGDQNVLVVRAKHLDEWTKEFLSSNPDAVVLNLGCGLDSRASRIGPPPGVDWFDVDYQDVISERQKFYSNHDGYQMVASSLTEATWLQHVPRDRPAIIIADGVLEYLAEDDVRTLFNRLTGLFPRGQLAFDVMSSYAMNSRRSDLKAKTGAEFKWAVDDVRAVSGLDHNLNLVSNLSLFRSKYLPPRYRLFFRAISFNRRVADMIRLLRYDFG